METETDCLPIRIVLNLHEFAITLPRNIRIHYEHRPYLRYVGRGYFLAPPSTNFRFRVGLAYFKFEDRQETCGHEGRGQNDRIRTRM